MALRRLLAGLRGKRDVSGKRKHVNRGEETDNVMPTLDLVLDVTEFHKGDAVLVTIVPLPSVAFELTYPVFVTWVIVF